jgi:ABC-type proline/glycine betaine transport system permease subunit
MALLIESRCGLVWCDVSYRICVAGLSGLLHKAMPVLFALACCELSEFCASVLVLGCCKCFGMALVKAASLALWLLLLSRFRLSSTISFLSYLICRPRGIWLKRKCNEVCIISSQLG